MPILWRYLITDFLKIAIACVLAFVTLLLTMQLDDIAHFAGLGAPLFYILLFTLHQIPYILPIALPLSCLIASLLLVQRLSNTHELTALRASGFALRDILAPIWLTALFLTLANFWGVSELATRSHLQSNLLKSELRSINPLLVLQNKHLMRLKGFYFESLGPSHVGESASDILLALPNRHHHRIDLMIAKQLKSSSTQFNGEGITLITGMNGEDENDFDPLLVENIKTSSTPINDFSDMLQKKVWTIHNDYLPISLLLARIQEQRQQINHFKITEQSKEKPNKETLKTLKIALNQSLSELTKRFSIAIAVLSFTLMGTTFGMHIGRKRNHVLLYTAITLTTLYLVAFFVAKGVDHQFWLATSLYLTPHLIIILASLFVLRRIARGIES